LIQKTAYAEFGISLDPNNPDSGIIDSDTQTEEKIQLVCISMYVPFPTGHVFIYITVGSTIAFSLNCRFI
jgi:hypothetical protein